MRDKIRHLSFEPIVDSNTQVLILGSLPGKKSLELSQYYGHPRNRIWKILSHITGNKISSDYKDKIKFLQTIHVGLWDVAKSAFREGSLDSNIKKETPNDIEGLLSEYSSISVIGFNGKKSEKIFYKYFNEKPKIKYLYLPSTSPANMAISFEDICNRWSDLFV